MTGNIKSDKKELIYGKHEKSLKCLLDICFTNEKTVFQ